MTAKPILVVRLPKVFTEQKDQMELGKMTSDALEHAGITKEYHIIILLHNDNEIKFETHNVVTSPKINFSKVKKLLLEEIKHKKLNKHNNKPG